MTTYNEYLYSLHFALDRLLQVSHYTVNEFYTFDRKPTDFENFLMKTTALYKETYEKLKTFEEFNELDTSVKDEYEQNYKSVINLFEFLNCKYPQLNKTRVL